ncbi:MAG: thioredoxin [Oscillospiraceae bacterium]|nr:thioredoxin [Oscillospiraceae bacterium]
MNLLTITKDNFQEEVLNSKVPVLLDFWAEWCGPCRMLSPIIHEIAQGLAENSAKVGKVNVDEEPNLAEAFGIVSIPTIIVMKDGKIAAQTAGVRPKEAILKMLAQ